MKTGVAIAFLVVLGTGLLVLAARGQRLPAVWPLAGRGRFAVVTGLCCAVFGVALPALIIGIDRDRPRSAGGARLARAQVGGRDLFTANCSSCHTLAAAGAAGTVGPNLDRLKPQAALVVNVIEQGRMTARGRMPAGLLSGPNAQRAARYVAAVAGR